MEQFLARVRTLWNTWDLRILVLLSLSLQIILTLLGNRRRSISSLWISVFVWLAYLMADWTATVALGKLSDTQVNYGNGKSLRALWAPLLLLHLGGPDTITAYSMEDNHLWTRHFFGLVVQFSVAVYVIIMSWTHSWFSTMSIPALVAGLIKYGERTYVLRWVCRDRYGDIVPIGYLGEGSDLGTNNTSEDKKFIRVLYIAHECLKKFKKYMLSYDLMNQDFSWDKVDDINLLWNAIEVEMGLMFDLFYTKTPINFRKRGWILRCITFVCIVTVVIGSTFELISTREDREKWHKVDIAITEVLVVGALALEIYAIIALYLFSDWAMLWLIKHKYNRLGKQVIQLRKKISWLFLPKQYQCNMMGHFDFISSYLKSIEADRTLINRILLLLGIDHSEYRSDKYVHKTAVPVNSRLLDPILDCCQRLRSGGRLIQDNWTGFDRSKIPPERQIFWLHITTEVCYNVEMEWDTHDDDASESSVVVSQHTMPPSGSSSSLEENRELSRTLSRYMMYILVMRPLLLPTASSDKDHLAALKDELPGAIRYFYSGEGTPDVRAACQHFLEIDEDIRDMLKPGIVNMCKHLQSKQKVERWEMLKSTWVKMLCNTAIKCHRYEHLRQLTQGGEFLTFLWFFIAQSRILSSQQKKEEVNKENSSQQEPQHGNQ
ncbi:hypothetical protein Vadar_020538 [Vaccinium darrowii]|uniref:Uncharacterized protein n=1 Tax=Vaccinium darrowii TaxID=229202 RepID=A0ACB7ZKN6_9ERIC|nr:hypothetical protein Vadar_020538 [Vaccinium darrowii]